jgi:hypothetical protein
LVERTLLANKGCACKHGSPFNSKKKLKIVFHGESQIRRSIMIEATVTIAISNDDTLHLLTVLLREVFGKQYHMTLNCDKASLKVINIHDDMLKALHAFREKKEKRYART